MIGDADACIDDRPTELLPTSNGPPIFFSNKLPRITSFTNDAIVIPCFLCKEKFFIPIPYPFAIHVPKTVQHILLCISLVLIASSNLIKWTFIEPKLLK